MRRDVFQAIADPTRRAILTLLALQAMTPNAIAEHFKLVKQEQTGREIYYHFNPQKMKEVDVWIEQLRAAWESRFTQLDDVLKNLKNKKP